MYKGEYCGKNAQNILILGESHHGGEEGSYTTTDVIKAYLENPAKIQYRFFDRIVETFGFSPDTDRKNFWNNVYFGNYIDELCGVGDDAAKKVVSKKGNREKLNRDLFDFIISKGIDTIYCFSILSYNHLPSITKNEGREEKIPIGKNGSKNVLLRQCIYKKGVTFPHTNKILKNDLIVYGIWHPSKKGGYPLDMFQKALQGKITLK